MHSPFAFNLITNVIYEGAPYYKYVSLVLAEERQTAKAGKDWMYETRRAKRLLFRLVNYSQPRMIIDAGTLSASALYLQAGKTSAAYVPVTSPANLKIKGTKADFLYLHNYRDPAFCEEMFRKCAEHANARSLFVIEGIHASQTMRGLWKAVQEDSRVSVTFDLYDMGLVFFDPSKCKQNYIVNF